MSSRVAGIFTQPPTASGVAATPAYGERAVAVTNGSVTHISLTGDIFAQPPDGAGNASSADFMGEVEVEFDADGDDIMILCGATNLSPSFSANSGSNPHNVGRIIYASANATNLTSGQTPRRICFRSGSKAGECNILSAISRSGNATLRYRVVSAIPGAR